MNFLDRLAIPEAAERLQMLRYLLVLVTLIFAVYASIVVIAATASAIFDRRGRKTGNESYSRFARDLAHLAVPSRGVLIALGVLPLVTLTLIYAQLLYGMKLGVSTYLSVAALFTFVGYYFLARYERSFRLESIMTAFQRLAASGKADVKKNIAADVDSFERAAAAHRFKDGRRAAILLWIGTWIFLGTTRLAFTPAMWSHPTFWTVVFSGKTIWSLLDFLVMALVVSSAAVMVFFFRFEHGIALDADDSYRKFVRHAVLPVGLVGLALEPILLFFEIQNLPLTGVSNATFGVAGIGMFVALFLLIMFYFMLKDSAINLGSYALAGVVLLVLVWAAKDEMAFRYATRVQDQHLGARYEALLASMGEVKPPPVMSGEDIYNARCSACHRFDRKLVGPPYFMTLPHFVGKMDSLEDFINNPYQAVPGYPPMPNQGLKPQEVKNIAEYIMGVYLAASKKGEAKVVQ